jgi:hypothetical protein
LDIVDGMNSAPDEKYWMGSTSREEHGVFIVGESLQRVVDNSVLSLVTSFEHYNTLGCSSSV